MTRYIPAETAVAVTKRECGSVTDLKRGRHMELDEQPEVLAYPIFEVCSITEISRPMVGNATRTANNFASRPELLNESPGRKLNIVPLFLPEAQNMAKNPQQRIDAGWLAPPTAT